MARFRFQMGEGLSVSTADNTAGLRLRSMAQVRATSAWGGRGGNEVSARGVRISLEGRVWERRLVFQVETALSPDEVEEGSGLLDAWVSWKFGGATTLRLGQQRVFYDMLSALRRLGNGGIARENISQEFGILRDIGVSLFSEDFFGLDERLACRLGVFGGQGRNRFALKRSGFLSVARLTLRPFGYFDDTTEADVERLGNLRLAVGLSAAYLGNMTRDGGNSGAFFDSFSFPSVDAFYWNVDAMLKWKGVYVAGQYSRRTSSRPFVENDTQKVWARNGHGYVLKVSGMLARRWELAGRFAQQFGLGRTSPALLEQPRSEFAAGLNHYFIGHALKAQLEYATRFDAKTPSQHWLRLQLQVVF
jgi:hypothetical protein